MDKNHETASLRDDQNKVLSLLLADDHVLVADAIKSFLEEDGSISVEVAEDFAACNSALSKKDFDVALVDLIMPGMDGLRSVEKLAVQFPKTPVVVFSGNYNSTLILRAIELGARGFIPKDTPLKTLNSIIRMVANGGLFIPRNIIESHQSFSHSPEADRPDSASLTPLEVDVIKLLNEGKTNKEIAWSINSTEVLVKMHMRNLCRKLEAKNRTHALVKAKELKII